MTRLAFSAPVVREIVSRAAGRCEQCGAACLSRADYEIDHAVAEAVQPANDNRAPLTADDGKLLCLKCHDKKTRRDVREIAKTKRLEERHRPIDAGQSEIARRYHVRQEPRR